MTDAVVGRVVVEIGGGAGVRNGGEDAQPFPWLDAAWVARLLEDCLADLSEAMGPDAIGSLQIDRLEADLGGFPADADPAEIYRRARETVSEQLRQLLSARAGGAALVAGGAFSARTGEGPGSVASGPAALEALRTFLRFGVRDWTAPAGMRTDDLIAAAAAAAPAETAALLRAALRDPAIARRLGDHLTAAGLEQALSAMATAGAGLLLAADALFRRLHAASPLASFGPAAMAAALRSAALMAAAETGAAAQPEREWVEAYTAAAGRMLDLRPEALLRAAAARLSQHDGGPADGLERQPEASIAAEIVRLATAAPGPPRQAPGGIAPAAMEALTAYLRTGTLDGTFRDAAGAPMGEGVLRQALRAGLAGGAAGAALRTAVGGALTGTAERAAAGARLRRLLPSAEAARAAALLGLPPPAAGGQAPAAAPPRQAGSEPEATSGSAIHGAQEADAAEAAEVMPEEVMPEDGVPEGGAPALFWFLMEYGALPWWGRGLALQPLDAWVARLVAERAPDLAAALRGMTEHRRALLIERMAARLSPGPLAAIAAAAPRLDAPIQGWLALAPAIAAARMEESAGGADASADASPMVPASAAPVSAAEQPEAAALAAPTISADRALHALAAVLLSRLFDPHAPRADWEALAAVLRETVARRLRLPRQAVDEAYRRALADGSGHAPHQPAPLPAAWEAPPGQASPPALAEQRPADAQEQGSAPPVGTPVPPSDAASAPEPPGEAVAPDTAAADLALVECFLSPALQLSVPVEELVALLSDGPRRRVLAGRLTAAQFDALAASLAPRDPNLRAAILESLAPAVSAALPAVTPAQWTRDVRERLAGLLASAVRGSTEGSAETALEALLRQQAIRYGRPFREHLAAVLAAAGGPQAAAPEALTLLRRIMEWQTEGAGAAAEAALSAGEAAASDAHANVEPTPGVAAAGQERQTSDIRAADINAGAGNRRIGLPESERPDGQALLAGFLASAPGSAEAEARLARLRQVLADPLRREVLAARARLSDLDLLAARLGLEGRGFLPSALPALARLAAAVLPGAGGPRWMQAALADLLGGMASGPARAPGVQSQLRHWLIRLAMEEGRDYADLVTALAAAAQQQPGGLPAPIRGALGTLAVTAAADAPVETLPPPSLPSDGPEERLAASLPDGPAAPLADQHASSTGSTTPDSDAAAPAPDSQPPNAVERPTASPPAGEPSRQAEPEDASRGQEGGMALLTGFLAAVPGTPESRRLMERMQALLADPQQRQALAARAPPAQLDLLAARLGLAGRVFPPSAITPLARLIEAALPGAGSARWAEAALANVLGAMAGGAEHASGAAGQLRLWLIRLAHDAGSDYAGLTAALAAQAERSRALPPGIRQALRTLAAAAAQDALPTAPDDGTERAGGPAPGGETGEGGDAAAGQEQAPPIARSGSPTSEAGSQAPSRDGSVSGGAASRPLAGPGVDDAGEADGIGNAEYAHEPTRSLLVRYLAGEGSVRPHLLDRLASPAERRGLAGVLSLAELDRLAARIFGGGGLRPGDVIALAPFLAGLLPSIPAEAWRTLVAQRLLAAAATTASTGEAPGVPEGGGGVPMMEHLLDSVLSTASSAAGTTGASLAAALQLAARQAGASLPPAVAAALARRVPVSSSLAGEGSPAAAEEAAAMGHDARGAGAAADAAGYGRAGETAEPAEPGNAAVSMEEAEAFAQFLAAEQAAPGFRSLAAAAWLALRRWARARTVPLPLTGEALLEVAEKLAEAGFPPPVAVGPSAGFLPEGGTPGDAIPTAGQPDARDATESALPALASAVLDPETVSGLRSRLAHDLAGLLEEDKGPDPDSPLPAPGGPWLAGIGTEQLHRLREAVERGLPLPEAQPAAAMQPLVAIIAGSVPEAGGAAAERALAAAMLRRAAARVSEIAQHGGAGAPSALAESRLADAALVALRELADRHGRPLQAVLADAARLAGQQPALETGQPSDQPAGQRAAARYSAGPLAEVRETLAALATGATDRAAASHQQGIAPPSAELAHAAGTPPEPHPAPSDGQSAEPAPGEPPAAAHIEPAAPPPAAEGWPWQQDGTASAAMPRDLIFVDDAGVVLLWPFLTHYFDRVGLLEGGRFASDATAARGVMLIHYMATAETETEEPRLVLPKLLCGVPFTVPVSPRIEPTDIEQTVSEELLNVVCQNWPPLRNSSVEALRETFLLREGSLSWLEEQIWLLKVSAKPFDMLLGQLPWTISTFKTPLMEHPVMVQWGNQ